MRNIREKKVISITGEDSENKQVVMSQFTGKISQQWTIIYKKDGWKVPKAGDNHKGSGLRVGKDFHIISTFGRGRYLDFTNESRNLIMKTQNGKKSQTWYFDYTSMTIRNRFNNKSLEISGSGNGKNMQWGNTSSKWW